MSSNQEREGKTSLPNSEVQKRPNCNPRFLAIKVGSKFWIWIFAPIFIKGPNAGNCPSLNRSFFTYRISLFIYLSIYLSIFLDLSIFIDLSWVRRFPSISTQGTDNVGELFFLRLRQRNFSMKELYYLQIFLKTSLLICQKNCASQNLKIFLPRLKPPTFW